MRLKDLQAAWNGFFFQPCSTLPMSIFRILIGLLVLDMLLMQAWPDIDFWYGPRGAAPLPDVMAYYHTHPGFDLLIWAQNSQQLHLFFATAVVAALCLTIGLATRVSALYLWLFLVSMQYHQPFNYNGGDEFMRFAVLWTALSFAGDRLSVDRWWRLKRGIVIPETRWPWAQRMLQLQLCIAYWQTSVVKLGGPHWTDGTAIYYTSRLESFFHLPVFGLFDSLLVCQALCWFTLVVEVSMWTIVWIKELRYWVLLAGLLLHLGIDYTMSLPIFEWEFISVYLLFIDPADLMRFFQWCKRFIASRSLPPAHRDMPGNSAAIAPE